MSARHVSETEFQLPTKLVTGMDRFGGTVKRVAMKALGFFAAVTVLPALILGRVYEHFSADRQLRNDLRNTLAKERLKALEAVVKAFPGLNFTMLEGNSSLRKELSQIFKAIEKAPREKLHSYIQNKVREPLVKIINSLEYQELQLAKGAKERIDNPLTNEGNRQATFLNYEGWEKYEPDFPLVDIVESAAQALHNKSKIGDAYLNLGIALTGDANVSDDPSVADIHQLHRLATENNPGFGDSLVSRMFMAILHPGRVWNSISGHNINGASYNSYSHGNANAQEGKFKVNGKKFTFVHSPTPTGEGSIGIIGSELKRMKKRDKTLLFHSVQFPGTGGEDVRTEKLLALSRSHQNMHLLITPMDGPMQKMGGIEFGTVAELKTALLNFASSGDYTKSSKVDGSKAYHEISKYMDNGFYCNPDLLSDVEFASSFEQTAALFTDIDVSKLASDEKKRFARAFLALTSSRLSLIAMEKISSKIEVQGGTFIQACKQDIDRGRVLNTLTRLLAQEELTESDVYELVGLSIGRAKLVDGRAVLPARSQVLDDALYLLSLKPGFRLPGLDFTGRSDPEINEEIDPYHGDY